jgi:hypothetical protein
MAAERIDEPRHRGGWKFPLDSRVNYSPDGWTSGVAHTARRGSNHRELGPDQRYPSSDAQCETAVECQPSSVAESGG